MGGRERWQETTKPRRAGCKPARRGFATFVDQTVTSWMSSSNALT
jgi:hypothetical protein